jgi:hypothetical protein
LGRFGAGVGCLILSLIVIYLPVSFAP